MNPRALCTVCKRLYREPKILPCLHTFCSDCIRQLEPFSVSPAGGPGGRAKGAGQPGGGEPGRAAVTVLCPVCDTEVDLPPSGPEGLSTDHLALDEVFLETLVTDGPLGCDLCGEGEAEKRCEVCSVNLCEFCCQAHRYSVLFYSSLFYSILLQSTWVQGTPVYVIVFLSLFSIFTLFPLLFCKKHLLFVI